MTHHIYSINHNNTITEVFAGASRYQCEKFLRDLRRSGRMTHFYRISVLTHDRARRKFAN